MQLEETEINSTSAENLNISNDENVEETISIRKFKEGLDVLPDEELKKVHKAALEWLKEVEKKQKVSKKKIEEITIRNTIIPFFPDEFVISVENLERLMKITSNEIAFRQRLVEEIKEAYKKEMALRKEAEKELDLHRIKEKYKKRLLEVIGERRNIEALKPEGYKKLLKEKKKEEKEILNKINAINKEISARKKRFPQYKIILEPTEASALFAYLGDKIVEMPADFLPESVGRFFKQLKEKSEMGFFEEPIKFKFRKRLGTEFLLLLDSEAAKHGAYSDVAHKVSNKMRKEMKLPPLTIPRKPLPKFTLYYINHRGEFQKVQAFLTWYQAYEFAADTFKKTLSRKELGYYTVITPYDGLKYDEELMIKNITPKDVEEIKKILQNRKKESPSIDKIIAEIKKGIKVDRKSGEITTHLRNAIVYFNKLGDIDRNFFLINFPQTYRLMSTDPEDITNELLGGVMEEIIESEKGGKNEKS